MEISTSTKTRVIKQGSYEGDNSFRFCHLSRKLKTGDCYETLFWKPTLVTVEVNIYIYRVAPI